MGVSSGNKAFSIIALLVSTSHLRLNWCGMDALTDDRLTNGHILGKIGTAWYMNTAMITSALYTSKRAVVALT